MSLKYKVRLLIIGLPVLIVSGLSTAEKSKEHPLKPVLHLVENSLKTIENIPAYQATFTKTELVGNRIVTQRMKMKFRREPFSVYFYFLGELEGREVIYIQDSNDGQLLAHETGIASLVGTLRLTPTDAIVMSENRHPITEAGIDMAKQT